MTWNEFNILHEKYSNRSAKIFRLAIIRHFNKMLEAAQMNGFQNLDQILLRVDADDIRTAFKKTYEGAGVDMAFKSYDEMRAGKKARQYIDTDGGRKKVRDEWIRQIEGIILDETIPAQGAVLTTSKEIFVDFVDEALQEGMTTAEIAKGLRKRFREIAPWRSFNIARTETLSAMNFGSEMGAQETGYQYKRTWLASLDGRERKSHAAVHGTTDTNGVWVVEQPTGGSPDFMRFPGDPRASAANRVNCRCTITRELI